MKISKLVSQIQSNSHLSPAQRLQSVKVKIVSIGYAGLLDGESDLLHC